jgi:hypothetical protein
VCIFTKLKAIHPYYFIARILALDDDRDGDHLFNGLTSTSCGSEIIKANGPVNKKSKKAGERLEEARSAILSGKINWSHVVFTASNNYVLQTLYVKFRDFRLYKLLPRGMASHLEQVYLLNLKRNRKMLVQAAVINHLLKSGGITPIFLKGTGNLADNLYSDPGERIMTDIDILTGPHQMEAAASILIANGYKTHIEYKPEKSKAMKHFPVLYREGEPASVDIHRQPVNIQYADLFDFELADRHKRPAKGDPSFMVMSDKHKIWLGFIHSQLIHWGHYTAMPSLRDL